MRYTFLILFLSFFCLVSGVAQDNNLAVDATVKDSDGGRLTGAYVNLYQDGNLINKVTAGRNGRFDLILDFGHEYVIEVGKTGFVSKRLYFNTHNVPEDEQAWGYEFGGFIVDLFREIDGVDFSVLDDPIGKVYYEARIQNFEYDRQYTKQLKEQIQQLEDAYKAKVRQNELLEKQLEEDFELAMRDGQLALEAKDFLTAKENFLAASSLKPDAPEPDKKIQEVETAIERESGTEEKYLAALASADQLLEAKSFAEAKAKYDEALVMKPGESYPKTQIAKCNTGIKELAEQRKKDADQKIIDEKYQSIIALADKELSNESYQAAKRLYGEAQGVKESEEYPKVQIAKIDGLIAAQAGEEDERKKQEEAERQYNELISRTDALLSKGDYNAAIEGYEKALELKPNESYPKDKIKEAKAGIEDQQLAAEKDQLQKDYRALLEKADGQFQSKDFDAARISYNEALKLQPAEQYPQSQLQAIEDAEAKLAENAALKEKEAELIAKYQKLIQEADITFQSGNFDESISKYNEAKSLQPKETYPDEQLAAIEARKAELLNIQKSEEKELALQREYDDLIAKADKEFQAESYNEAASIYKQAQQIKAKEIYPKTQLDIIALRLKELADSEKALLADKKVQAAYDQAIAAADRALSNEDLDVAENGYREAAKILPSEKYPEEQLAVIAEKRQKISEASAAEAAEQKRRSEYEDLVMKADKSYEAEELLEAKSLYEQALAMFGQDQYPKDRIAQIDIEIAKREKDTEKRAEMLKLTAEYEAAIQKADQLLKDDDLEASKYTYASALEIKPNEVYPKNQMAKIAQLMDQRATAIAKEEDLQKRYDDAMRDGDKAMTSQNWEEARKAYQEALTVFPDSKIPRDKLLEIGNLEDREEEMVRKAAYDDLIAQADQTYLEQNFEDARDIYTKSLSFFPNATHPKERIARIGKILEELNEKYTEEERKLEKTIVEESFMEGNREITIRTVTIGDKEQVYKRVIHPWGGKYYFLDNTAVSELVWTRETTSK